MPRRGNRTLSSLSHSRVSLDAADVRDSVRGSLGSPMRSSALILPAEHRRRDPQAIAEIAADTQLAEPALHPVLRNGSVIDRHDG